MIRSNLPLPFLYRLRLQADSATRRAFSAPSAYRQSAGASAGRPPNARQAAARRPVGGDAGHLWNEFVDQYERFTDVLCVAAKSGCDSRTESEYAQLRRWFVTNYYRLSARLRPYFDAEFQDEAGGLADTPVITDYAGQRRSLDVLEALFLPPTLRELLKHDTGNLIPRVARVSEAVYRCHDEWLAAQEH